MDCSPPGSSVHGVFQARTLERVAVPSHREFSRPRDETCISYVSCIGRQVLHQECHLGSPRGPIKCLWNTLDKETFYHPSDLKHAITVCPDRCIGNVPSWLCSYEDAHHCPLKWGRQLAGGERSMNQGRPAWDPVQALLWTWTRPEPDCLTFWVSVSLTFKWKSS